jgi:hypothetical protein
MFKIYYKTHARRNTVLAVDDIGKVRDKLERLWKARISAQAFEMEEKREVGAVHRLNGKLTWYCE